MTKLQVSVSRGRRRRFLASGVPAIAVAIIAEAALVLLAAQSQYLAILAITTIEGGLLAIGFNIIAGFGGRLAFGNQLFFGLGAYAIGVGSAHGLWSPLSGLAIAIVGSFVLAYVLGHGLARLSGMLFALATFALALIAMGAFNSINWLGGSSGVEEPLTIAISVSKLSYRQPWQLALGGAVLTVLMTAFTVWLKRSSWGARLQSARDDPTAAETCGVNVVRMQAVAWGISAAVTACAGVMFMQNNLIVEPSSVFGFNSGVEVIVPAIVGGVGTVLGPIFGSGIVLAGGYLNQLSSNGSTLGLNNFFYGAILILVVRLVPGGLMGLGRLLRFRSQSGLRPATTSPAKLTPRSEHELTGPALTPESPLIADSLSEAPQPDGAVLELDNVWKSFGAVTAVAGVSLAVRPGTVVGLLGPNGSGKTTLFNCISGVTRPERGVISVNGRDLVGKRPYRVAQEGVARTYQTVRLFSAATVLENAELPLLWRVGRAAAQERARTALAAVGLGAHADLFPGELSLAEQRRLEVARAVVTEARVILLDEVMAGLSREEAARIGELILSLCTGLNIAFVVVEHVMGSLMSLCDEIVVLDQGVVLATGEPDEVLRRPEVVTAYFGSVED